MDLNKFITQNENNFNTNKDIIFLSLNNFFEKAKKDLSMSLYLLLKDYKIKNEDIQTIYILLDHDYEENDTIHIYANKKYDINMEEDILGHRSHNKIQENIYSLIDKIISYDLLFYFCTQEQIEISFDEQKAIYEKMILDGSIKETNINNQKIVRKI